MNAIEFDSVTLDLGRRRILSGVSFAIESGAFVGVLGPNGAGKTTIMRAALGLLPVQGGRIRVLGEVPRRGNPAIGYVPQSRRGAAQLDICAFEFLLGTTGGKRWGRPVASPQDRHAVAAALDRVGAGALARRPLSELSGGERQRVFIAQALIGSPRLLLLDEPLISLDPAHQHAIVELVRGIARERGIAVLLSAHEINPLIHAVDQVLYLGGGHAAIGPVDEVVTSKVLSALYNARVEVVRVRDRIFVIADEARIDGHDAHEHEHDEDGDDHHAPAAAGHGAPSP